MQSRDSRSSEVYVKYLALGAPVYYKERLYWRHATLSSRPPPISCAHLVRSSNCATLALAHDCENE